jgi:hypothetical protein
MPVPYISGLYQHQIIPALELSDKSASCLATRSL